MYRTLTCDIRHPLSQIQLEAKGTAAAWRTLTTRSDSGNDASRRRAQVASEADPTQASQIRGAAAGDPIIESLVSWNDALGGSRDARCITRLSLRQNSLDLREVIEIMPGIVRRDVPYRLRATLRMQPYAVPLRRCQAAPEREVRLAEDSKERESGSWVNGRVPPGHRPNILIEGLNVGAGG
jgi:hypothetical protein